MGRPRRHQPAGHIFHIINRGNGGAVVFHKDTDYQAFLDLLEAGKSKFSVRVLAFCVMPNHFHIVVQPETEATLSPFMKWWQPPMPVGTTDIMAVMVTCGRDASKTFRSSGTSIYLSFSAMSYATLFAPN